ncbi:single-stranded-DNA-specific exonuclease RecJ [Nautilia sp.]
MLTKAKIKEILSNRIEELSSSNLPHFSLLRDIDRAAERIVKAVRNGEKIVVVGDYDADGVGSSAVMKLFFKKAGIDVDIVIPDRFTEGYGLGLKLLERIKADLIITVDNGITSFEAAEECKKRGIDLIITDHHTPLINKESINGKKNNAEFKLPEALAIVNPKISPDFPFKEICGAEVAWYLCAALKAEMKINVDLREFTDIVSISVIADVMPLTHMNRTVVNMGLKRLNKGVRPFSAALKKFFNKEFKSEDIAFQIAPRINAAGRMEHADRAYRFLISEDENEAYGLLMELDRLNSLRKETEKAAVEEIENPEGDFIVIKGNYHEGVVGIIASRLVYKFKKPAIVLSENNGVLKGSGRSLGNIDIFGLVSECGEFLEGFGGHKMACGLSLKNEMFETFKKALNEKIAKYSKEDFFIEDYVLGELPFSEIDIELLDILKSFEPFGEGNPKPKFVSRAKVENVQNLKDNHFKLILSQDDILLPAVLFRYDGEFEEYINFKFTVSENAYYGRSVQLIIEEIL